jgi:hypothetical protein
MKYFNKYNNYKPVTEKVTRDFDIGVLDILMPLFSKLGRVVSKNRLRAIATAYDSYLSIVYKQYISSRKLNIPEDKVDTFNYKDLNNTLTVKPISKDGKKAEIMIDDDNLDDMLNDGQVNDDSTSGLAGGEPLNINVDDDNTEVEEIEKTETETDTDSKDDDDLEEIVLDDDLEDDTEGDTEVGEDKTELEKSVDSIDSENEKLKQKASKFNKGQRVKNPIINGERVDISELDIKYDENMTDEEKTEVQDIINSYANNQTIKEMLFAISETEKEIEIAKAEYTRYKEEKKKYGELRTNTTGDLRKEYQEEINRYSQMMSDSDADLKGATEGLEEMKNELDTLYAKNGINESKNWTGTDMYSSDWTKEDMDEITDMVNPYKLIELDSKAKIIIENSSGRSTKKLQVVWDTLKNDIHKRWYYTYDINKLESKAKTSKALADKKTTPEEKKNIKDTMSISMAMKEIFKSDIDTYSSPSYLGLENDKKVYFLLNTDKKVFLMERLAYIEDKYVFKLVAKLSVTEDKKFTIERFFNTYDKGMTIELGGKSFDLYKEENKSPILIFKKLTNNLYSLPMATRNDTDYIDLISLSISSLADGLNTKGLVIDDSVDLEKSLGDAFEDDLTKEEIETIKNLKI